MKSNQSGKIRSLVTIIVFLVGLILLAVGTYFIKVAGLGLIAGSTGYYIYNMYLFG